MALAGLCLGTLAQGCGFLIMLPAAQFLHEPAFRHFLLKLTKGFFELSIDNIYSKSIEFTGSVVSHVPLSWVVRY